MTIRFYFAILISAAAAFATSENNGTGLTISAIPRARVGVGSGKNQTDERTKRALSDSERDSILNAFNCRRSLLGTSDMTYLTWSSSLEDDVYNFMQPCDFRATINTAAKNRAFFRNVAKIYVGHKTIIDLFFDQSSTTLYATSKYLLQVGGGYKDCTSSGGHFYAYLISATGGFNPTSAQYTSGSACTSCEAGVNWCYNNLCRDDCSNSISGCCPITNNVPAQCESSNLICQSDPAGSDPEKAVNTVKPASGSSSTEVKASIMMLVIVSAFNYYFL